MEPGCNLTVKELEELEGLQQALEQGIEEVQRRFPRQFRRELQTSRAALKAINEVLVEAKQMRTTA